MPPAPVKAPAAGPRGAWPGAGSTPSTTGSGPPPRR